LIVENDLSFARVLLEAAREQGFKGLVTSQGTAALNMVAEHRPTAILLDIFLPDIDGWRVLSRLKNDLGVRHIPVHVISTDGPRAAELLRSGRLDCAVVNPETPGLDFAAVMSEIHDAEGSPPPVIAYGRGRQSRQPSLERIPGVHEVHSIERLLDQVVLALHVDATRVKEAHRQVLDEIYGSTKALAGRRVLI